MTSQILSRIVLLTLGVSIFIQFRLQTLGVAPISSKLPALPVFPTFANQDDGPPVGKLTGKIEIVGENDLVMPECLVVSEGFLFGSLGDGRVVRLLQERDAGESLSWITLVRTGQVPIDDPNRICGNGGPSDTTNVEVECGRPLGMTIVKRSSIEDGAGDEDVLVVADAQSGLLMICGIYGPAKEVQLHTLATRASTDDETYRFQFLNGIVQTEDGTIYVSETSQVFPRRRVFLAAFDGNPTGRLLKYSKEKGSVDVVAQNIYMPNGLAVSHDNKHIIVVSGVQMLRYSLGKERMESEPFVEVMPGTGDNVDAQNYLPTGEKRKCYWAGLGSKFSQPFSLLKALSEKPILKGILCAFVPYNVIVEAIPKLSALAVFDENGELIDIYQDDNVTAPWLSEGKSYRGYLYLGSWYNPFLARVKLSLLK